MGIKRDILEGLDLDDIAKLIAKHQSGEHKLNMLEKEVFLFTCFQNANLYKEMFETTHSANFRHAYQTIRTWLEETIDADTEINNTRELLTASNQEISLYLQHAIHGRLSDEEDLFEGDNRVCIEMALNFKQVVWLAQKVYKKSIKVEELLERERAENIKLRGEIEKLRNQIKAPKNGK